jgi:hypothetical protein
LSKSRGPNLGQRVEHAATRALQASRSVAPVEVFCGIGWLPSRAVDHWRQGRVGSLDQAMSVGPEKLAEALETLATWARAGGLVPSEVDYLAATRDRRPLRFTAGGDRIVETACRTHWISPELSQARRDRLTERQSKPPDLVVIEPVKEFSCTGCGGTGPYLIMEDPGPLCLTCADMDHLVFLPAGNAALSRRAKADSTLAAVVVRWSRPRRRYERQGILVEEAALERAEEQCLADAEVRRRRRERDAERRADQDVEFQDRLAREITRLYPGCPPSRAQAIAVHAAARGSGRVGRSAAARALDAEAIKLAVVASIRHEDTGYDKLLMSGTPRDVARDRVRAGIDKVLDAWQKARQNPEQSPAGDVRAVPHQHRSR